MASKVGQKLLDQVAAQVNGTWYEVPNVDHFTLFIKREGTVDCSVQIEGKIEGVEAGLHLNAYTSAGVEVVFLEGPYDEIRATVPVYTSGSVTVVMRGKNK